MVKQNAREMHHCEAEAGNNQSSGGEEKCGEAQGISDL